MDYAEGRWVAACKLGMLLFSVLLVVGEVRLCGSRALPLTTIGNGIEVPPPEILRFMRRFGYLESNPSDAESLYHESAIVEAIKNIQKYGALNQTGQLDNATLNLLTQPRCGVPDMEGTPYYLTTTDRGTRLDGTATEWSSRRKRYVIGARPWTKRRIRYFIANRSWKIPREQVKRNLASALALWSQYSGLHFEHINDTAADIIVGFGSRYHGDNFPFDGPGNILAHAYYPYEMGSWGGDVHFDEDENWVENSTDLTNGVDFYSVAVHELGHSLGLAHSSTATSIMFPYYKGPEQSTLDYDDTLAMYEMYLSKQLEDESPTTEADQALSTTVAPAQSTTVATAQKRFDEQSPPSSTPHAPLSTQPVWTHFNAKPELSRIPNICLGKFDAVAMIRGVVHIFKREYVWKLTNRYTVMNGYPLSIYEMFPFLPPQTVKRIDAAYERHDGAGVFFTGQSFWVFNGSKAIENSPKPLAQLLEINSSSGGDVIPRVDAAMLWPKNNCTYLFAGAKFWRYNDRLQSLDNGYPKSMLRWPGIPSQIDAAATLTNGKTYFFKHNLYWLYDNAKVRPERGYPRRASIAWLGCPPPTKRPLRNFNTTVTFISA